MNKSVAGMCYQQGAPLVVEDAPKYQYFFDHVDKVLNWKTHQIMAAPIMYHEKKIGVLQAVNKTTEDNFSDSDVATAEVIASYIGIAIQRVSNDHELQKARAQLEELDRLKSDFIAITSHELRTPLGLILGHATFLQETISSDADRKQLEVILRNAKRLKEIIEAISNVENYFNGKATLRLSKVDANDIVRACIKEYLPKAKEKQIKMDAKLPPSKVVFTADPEKVKIAINNLLDNAVIFSNANGSITVTVEQSADFVNISVSDNGIGIPTQDIDKIFERFFQVQSHMTRHHGGLGLGLSVTKAMVDLHRGQILVDSAEGMGSNFTISLPKENQESFKTVKAFL
jgi:signal transduction histidine kinase